MAALTNTVLDGALNVLTSNGDRIDLCSSEPTTYSGISSVSLGNKTSLSIGSPADRSGGGREVTVAAITSSATGSITGTGTATHYAISNGSDTLYATGSLSASQAVTSGNTFTLAAFTIAIPDPA
ncbi:hypothetical protein N9M73_07140 [Rhodobacteraceae bacterium]|nr:hypothetical protein [Paracoccaceae bacterium]